MRIDRIEIHGFKSFAERTVFQFGQGVSCVVGPNGCGKSNVIDAIKWGLGEQNARQLRGRAMEDVIFGGSESRPATGLAEVAMLFDNGEGLLGGEYARLPQVEIRRRLFRSGESEYLINGEPVRLREVTSLFLDTGVGTRGYSIIEQGRVGLIVNARPEERRFLVEEAAGISRYKSHRAEAERRMEQTRQNLSRIRDVAEELRKQVGSLKRAASKASRYRALRGRLRHVEIYVALARTRELVEEYRVRADALASLEERLELAAGRIARAEAEASRLVEQRARTSAEVDAAKERRSKAQSELEAKGREREYREREAAGLARRAVALGGEVDRAAERLSQLDAETSSLRVEVAELEGRAAESQARLQAEAGSEDGFRREAEGLARSIEALKRQAVEALTEVTRTRTQLSGIERREEEIKQRSAHAERDRGTVAARVEALEADLGALRTEVEGARVRGSTLRAQLVDAEGEAALAQEARKAADARHQRTAQDLNARKARLRSLQEIQQRFEGFQRGVRDVMARRGGDPSLGVLGTVADVVDAPPEHEQAVEAALGERLQAIVVRDHAAAAAALADLRSRNAGRAAFVPVAGRGGLDDALPEGEGVLGPLRDVVRAAAPEQESVLDVLLGDAVLVRSLDDALRLWGEGRPRRLLVTPEGDVLAPDGLLTGGAGDRAGAGILQQRRDLRSLEREVRTLGEREEGERAVAAEAREDVARRQRRIDEIRASLHSADLERVARERDLHALEKDLEGRRHLAKTLGAEVRGLEASHGDLSREAEILRRRLVEAESLRARREEESRALESRALEAAARLEKHRAALTEHRLEAASKRQALENARRNLGRVSSESEALASRLERDRAEVASARDRGARLGEEARGLAREVEALSVEVSRAGEDVLGALERHRLLSERHSVAEGELQAARGDRDAVREEMQSVSVRVAELRVELTHVRDGVKERFDLELQPLFRRLDEEGEVELLDPSAAPPATAEDGDDEEGAPTPPASMRIAWDDLVDAPRLTHARAELSALRGRLEKLGEVNLTAPEEYAQATERHEFILSQQRDLEESLEQIRKAIARIDRSTRERFRETFDAINERFQVLYPRLVGGGRGFLRLTDENDLLETGIDLIVQPPGKRLQNMTLMSGGEKAMAAIALIFAIFLVKPSPFCLLDEVDAPLDEANAVRFNEMVQEMSGHTQFLVITHNKSTMEVADTLYGVTMEEPGVSRLVSVRLEGGTAPVGPGGSEVDALPARS